MKLTKTEQDAAGEQNNSVDLINSDKITDLKLELFVHALHDICSMLGKAESVGSLRADLSLNGDFEIDEERINLALERMNLCATVVKSKITPLEKTDFPCLALMLSGSIVVVTGRHDKDNTVMFMEDGKHQLAGTREFNKLHDGHIIQIRHATSEIVEKDQDTAPAKWFWNVFLENKSVYALVILSSIIINLLALVFPLVTLNVYDRVIPNYSQETLIALGVGALIALIFELGLRLLRANVLESVAKQVDQTMESILYRTILVTKLVEIPRHIGETANIIKEFRPVRELLSASTISYIADLPFLIVFLVILYWVGGDLFYVPVVAFIVAIIFIPSMQWPLRLIGQNQFQTIQGKYTILVETLLGLESVKLFNANSWLQKKWNDLNLLTSSQAKQQAMLSQGISFGMMFISQGTSLGILLYGSYLVSIDQLTIGGLIASNILASRATAILMSICTISGRALLAQSSFRAVNRLLDMKSERPVDKTFMYKPVINGEIEFRSVEFSYPEQKRIALNNVSFKVTEGEKVGIIGKSGSGKTTIQRLIAGIYEADEGHILLDGREVRQLDPIHFRRFLGVVPQDDFLIDGTIRENILVGRWGIDEKLILNACYVSGVDEFTRKDPDGLEKRVGERGKFLSGGQRQAVLLARAILERPSILLFDEPTGSMDNTLQDLVTSRLAKHLKNETLIVSTHRFPLLKLVERLIVVDDGKILLDGPKRIVLEHLKGSLASKERS